MSEESVIDVFKLCWDVILDEYYKFDVDGTFFNSEHCKISDSIDTNFDLLVNRLAYGYKYGCFNVLFFEKCFLNFIDECPDFEEVFPLKKLKICTLSNGPGFDIVGLLCALCVSNKPLKSVPKFSALNLYPSWSNFYKTLIYKAYSTICLKFSDWNQVKQENISLIQGDIFLKTLSPETIKCIASSNVLLLVKVFFCSKASLNKFKKSLMKIFLLVKPGALIFFIGSENNLNSFSRYRFLSNYVKNIYGPRKVTLEKVMINENSCPNLAYMVGQVGQKPVDSGSAEFVVWQKRSQPEIEELKKESQNKGKKQEESRNSKRRRQRKRATLKEETVDEDEKTVGDDDDDYSSDSEFSCSTSGSRLSDVSADVLNDSPHSNLSDTEKMKSKVPSAPLSQSNNSFQPIENFLSILNKTDFEPVKKDKIACFQKNALQHCRDNASDLKSDILKEACANILDVGMSGVNEAPSLNVTDKDCSFLDLMEQGSTASSLNCVNDKGELNLMKQTGLDNGVSVVGDSTCITSASDTDDLNLTKQTNLDKGVSLVSSASDEDYFDHDLMKQESTQVLDNVMSLGNKASSLSCANDKSHNDHDLMNQESTQVFDNGVSEVNEAFGLSCAIDKSHSDQDLMKQKSTQILSNVISSGNETSSLIGANDKSRSDHDLIKQLSTQGYDNAMTLENEASSLICANDKDNSDHDLIMQENSQVFDSGISLLNKASGLICINDKSHSDHDLTNQEDTQVFDNAMTLINEASSLNCANDKDHTIMKQESTQVFDNGVSVLNSASSLSNNDDKGCCDHDLMTQTSAYSLKNSMSVINDALNQSCSSHKNDYDFDLMKQKSTQASENGTSVVNEASSLSYVNDKSCCNDDLMEQASSHVQKIKDVLDFKHVESISESIQCPLNAQYTSHEITTKNLYIRETRDISVQTTNEIIDELGAINPIIESGIKSHENLTSLKQCRENIAAQEKNTVHPVTENIQKSNSNVNFSGLRTLIRKCEHLVTELENLTVSLNKDIGHAKRNSNCNNPHSQQIFECSQFPHHCCSCAKSVHIGCFCNKHKR